ncbi:unnamed protein product [Owenia fusiformis]|uniref:Uncharacterized protein n=1 Tax=Owenia fusiformis TaxID=6347 RepID=A0A8J1TYT3_OWEFU|nr:unnamed protein product [Owenia fusiformis]
MALDTETFLLVTAILVASGLVQSTTANGECVTPTEFFEWSNNILPDYYDEVASHIMEKPTISFTTNDTYGPGARIKFNQFDVILGNVDDPSIEYDGVLLTSYGDYSLAGSFLGVFLTTVECDYLNFTMQFSDPPEQITYINNPDLHGPITLAAPDFNRSRISLNMTETLTLFESENQDKPHIILPNNCADYKRYCFQIMGIGWITPLTCFPFDESLPYCKVIAPVQITDMHHYRFVPNNKILDRPSIEHVNGAPDTNSFLLKPQECETGIMKTFNDVFVVDIDSNQTSGNIKVKVDGVNMQCEEWARESFRSLVVKIHTNNAQVPRHSYLGGFRLCDAEFSNATETKCEFSCPCEGNICNPVFVDFLSMAIPSVSSICEVTVIGN